MLDMFNEWMRVIPKSTLLARTTEAPWAAERCYGYRYVIISLRKVVQEWKHNAVTIRAGTWTHDHQVTSLGVQRQLHGKTLAVRTLLIVLDETAGLPTDVP